ncbi:MULTISPECIES: isochorismatase family protein [Micromonospora]|uniref:isochorismatase family protein n=1 Tax=Micromonospora TaxID=1873 RepID=UPI001EEFE52A|nr:MULTISPECIES: isochorismatase family protein [unclassified Micromonospora]
MDALDPHRTAVILIDLQRRIVDLPTAPHTGADVVARPVALADAARATGATVVVVRVERPGPDPQPAGSELVPEAVPRPGDLEIVKHSWGAFHETRLDDALRARGIDTLVVAGLVTNFGVEQTARVPRRSATAWSTRTTRRPDWTRTRTSSPSTTSSAGSARSLHRRGDRGAPTGRRSLNPIRP